MNHVADSSFSFLPPKVRAGFSGARAGAGRLELSVKINKSIGSKQKSK